jgi:hypothetical protein
MFWGGIMAGFKISTNIERDANVILDYILTKNADDVFERIIYNYGRGQHAFSIIGSYGTGKSTFLWALQKHLEGRRKFTKSVSSELKGIKTFQFSHIVGESCSFKEKFCEVFGLAKLAESSNKKILKGFAAKLEEIQIQKGALVLLVDEFGKHLEFVAKRNPDELYFIQELAEFCNDNERNVLLITTLHQNFSSYAKGLSKAEKSEWDKVRGRFIDIAFDEPVEQLIFFASEKLKDHSVPKKIRKNFEKGVECVIKNNLIGNSSMADIEKLERLYPLDPLAADIITKSLQKFGQNERSLFTFLDSPELAASIDANDIFDVSDCFDYLTQNLIGEIEDGERNPFKPQFKAASLALERSEFLFEDSYAYAAAIIKTICLVNIFSPATGILDAKSLTTYSESFLEIEDASTIIDKLVIKKIIKYSNHRSKYNFIEGTDVDIEQELINANKFVDSDFDLVSRLKVHFNFALIPAKRIQFELGTPRFFGFNFYDEIPQNVESPKGEIDGYINLIFTKKRIESHLREYSNSQNTCQIFVLYKEIDEIHNALFQLDKINYLLNKFGDDKVAARILNEEKLFKLSDLKTLVEEALFSKDSKVKWIWNTRIDEQFGGSRNISSLTSLNRLLSDACEIAYVNTPKYLNEMVNREYLSSPILTARKALIRQMISNGDQLDLGFSNTLYPPEKTIYLSLLKNTGIHKSKGLQAVYGEPTDATFKPLWKASNEILLNSSQGRISIADFFDRFREGEFKLKHGFLDFWVSIFLIIKKEDYALYSDSSEYIPMLTSDVMDLIHKTPSKFFIKALSNSGVKSDYLAFYKELVGYNESNIKGLQSSYITIYGNFLRFYRGLEEYAQKTNSISNQAQGIRKAIVAAQDPESALFVEIPEALGFYGLEKGDNRISEFLQSLQNAIREIRSAYDILIDGIQRDICSFLAMKIEMSFEQFKEGVIVRYSKLNRNLILNDKLKLFFTRLVSPMDVKKAYWESLTDVILGKKLDKINDEEVVVLVDRMKDMLSKLDDLSPLHALSNENTDKSYYQVTIVDVSGNGSLKQNILHDEKKRVKANELNKKIQSLLSSDSDLNRMVLLELLQNLIENKGE